MTNSTKPKLYFWIISILALLWNLMGVKAYLEQAYMADETLASYIESHQLYIENLPAWVTAAFAIAVFAAAFGCIALLFRKKVAILLLSISLIAVLAQKVYDFFIQEYMEITAQNIVMPIMVMIVALFLVWFAKHSKSKGWLS